MDEKDIQKFASILEEHGYAGARSLIDSELLPAAKRNGTSLLAEAWNYANGKEEQDTSWYQLHVALVSIRPGTLAKLNIDEPLKED